MIKIVNGKTYNTNTATLLGEFRHGGANDFEGIVETLYRTPKGALFIAGEGGPQTEYRVITGPNEWSWGSRVTPLSTEAAIEWCERHGKTPVLLEHFSDQIEEA